MLMGDSAGGGFWDIKDYQDRDPILAPGELRVIGERWAGDLDPHDWRISPIYGDLAGIHNVTAFIGTSDILYPDAVKCFEKLDKDPSNELIVTLGAQGCIIIENCRFFTAQRGYGRYRSC